MLSPMAKAEGVIRGEMTLRVTRLRRFNGRRWRMQGRTNDRSDRSRGVKGEAHNVALCSSNNLDHMLMLRGITLNVRLRGLRGLNDRSRSTRCDWVYFTPYQVLSSRDWSF